MKQHIDELLLRVQDLQEELEEEYRKAREDLELKRAQLAEDFLRRQYDESDKPS